VADLDWALGMDPIDVERVEYLASQLDHYRENLPALEEFGYRPAWGGIWTGLVIVCGHVVPPPYQIEADLENDLVRLNGIELTCSNDFNVSGKCLAKVNAIRGARERAESEAKRRAFDARPGEAELCAKKKAVQDASLDYWRFADFGAA